MPFPIIAAVPSYYVEVHALDRHGNVFYIGDTITLSFTQNQVNNAGNPATKAFTGNYYVRNYYGTLITSGSVTAATSVTLAALPCGWYKIYLTQSTVDATYGTAAGSGLFSVLPVDSRFPSLAGQGVDGLHPGQLSRELMAAGAFAQGPARWVISAIGSYATDLGIVQQSMRHERNWYLNPAYQDAARPRRSVMLFNDGYNNPANVTAVVAALCAEFGAGAFWFEGPGNEPNGTAATNATRMQAFYNAVKAGDAAAQVIGPCPVAINFTLNQAGGYLANFFALVAAMNPVPLDGISFHIYNSHNGDLSLGNRCLTQFRTIVNAAGLGALPWYQTEQSQKTTENGVYMPRMAGRWDMQQILLLDQYGVPKEQSHLWYDTAHGFWAVPHFWVTDDTEFMAPGPLIGQFSREVYGKTFDSKVDFGSPGNDMMLGNRYHATAANVLVFQSAGQTDASLTLSVSGASSLTKADCFGNTSTLTVSGGKATVPVTMEPVYVRVPSSATVSVDPWRSDRTVASSFASVATPSSSGGTTNKGTNLHRVINSVHDTGYWKSVSSTRNNQDSPYFDDTGSFPATLTFTWNEAHTLDKVIVFASPPWQSQGTLLDFDVQTWNGSAWVTQQTFTEPALYSTIGDAAAQLFPFVENQRQGGCTVQSYFSERWIFDATFTSVTTTAFRLYIRSATYGMDPTVEALNAQFGDKTTFGNNFVVREVQAYYTPLAVPRVVMADA